MFAFLYVTISELSDRIINKIPKLSINRKSIVRIGTFSLGPWFVFIIFMMSFNAHYFGDPTTTMYNVPGATQHYITDIDLCAFAIEVERVEIYSGHFLT